MSSEWPILKIEEIAERVGMGPFGSSIKVETFVESGIPIISGEHLHDITLTEKKFRFITEQHATQLVKSNVFRGDVVFTHAGTIGQVSVIPKDSKYVKYILSQRQFFMRCNRELVNPLYVAYFFKSPQGRHKLLANASQVGVPSIARPVTYLRSIEIPVPPLAIQNQIVSMIESMRDRITLLRETNATLEAIAQALFKSWFVDFDPVRAKSEGKLPEGMDEAIAALFPNAFEETELRTLPKGWRQIKLSEICKVHRGCSYKGAGLSEDSGAYMFNLGCFNAPRVFALEKVKRYTGEYKDHHSVSAGDLIVANTDITQHRTILGRPLIVPTCFQKSFISHHVFRLELLNSEKSSMRNFLFFEFQQPEFRKRAIGYATGTTVLALSKDVLEGLGLTKPTDQVLEKFNEIVTPLFDSILKNEHQVQTLIKLRNTLLPRLISGQLRISDVKGQLEMLSA